MNPSIAEPLTTIFRTLFEDDGISLNPELTANDIDDWDSLNHMRLIHEIETYFNIKIPFITLIDIENVGDLVDTIDNLRKESRS